MTAAAIARLRAIHDQRRRLDDEEEQLLASLAGDDTLECAPPPSVPATIRGNHDKLIETSVAAKISGYSTSWLYKTARKYPVIGWRLDTGSWVWSEPALRAFLAGNRAASAECEKS